MTLNLFFFHLYFFKQALWYSRISDHEHFDIVSLCCMFLPSKPNRNFLLTTRINPSILCQFFLLRNEGHLSRLKDQYQKKVSKLSWLINSTRVDQKNLIKTGSQQFSIQNHTEKYHDSFSYLMCLRNPGLRVRELISYINKLSFSAILWNYNKISSTYDVKWINSKMSTDSLYLDSRIRAAGSQDISQV